ncbi:MAG: TonB-dependent copper receptor [Thiomargarita sp.]|nr:TonB-dependent copper receptor [Thiomargarita sp.]
MKFKPLILVSTLVISPSILADTVLPTVTVEGVHLLEPSVSEILTEESLNLNHDTGAFLRDTAGVSGTRIGGHGTDPIIRGQSQNRLNVLLDGAYVHGGCPNRMDPPTSYSPIGTYDAITILKGSQTVIYGGGGSGGTILLERKTPRLEADESIRGQIKGGYTSNSGTKTFTADVTAGNPQGFARAMIEYANSGNYKDGNGEEVRSAVTQESGNLTLGYTPSSKSRLELSIEATRIEDSLYAGTSMDAPTSNNDMARLRFKINGTKGDFYYSEVEHIMDNYSLRPIMAPMKMLVNSTSKTQGGRISHLFIVDKIEATLGVDYQLNNRLANRFLGPVTVVTPIKLQSIMWPDVDINQIGLFNENLITLRELDILKLGLRYDYVSSEANLANQEIIGGMTANNLYSQYYGKSAEEHIEHNFSGFIRYEHEFKNGSGYTFVNLSRNVRTADATERFLAANISSPALRWVGNPDLEPEQHHQIELGMSVKSSQNWNIVASAFYNHVTDFILRDRAHLQEGILQSDNATIYRNVDAELFGAEWEARTQWNPSWSSSLILDYVHATNITDNNRDIAQIPPFSTTLNVNYKHNWLRLGSNLRYAMQQRHVDDDPNFGSGLDAQKTPSFVVLDIYSAFEINKQATIKMGINNMFNRNYAYHVNRANVDPFSPDAIQVNEPGTSLWINFDVRF